MKVGIFGVLMFIGGLFSNIFAWANWSGTITDIQIYAQYSDTYSPSEDVAVITTSDGRSSWVTIGGAFGKSILAMALAAQANSKAVNLRVAENTPLNSTNGATIYKIYSGKLQ